MPYKNKEDRRAHGRRPEVVQRRRKLQKDWYGSNKDRVNADRRANYDPRKNRDSLLKSNYGISADDYDVMLERQGGCCAICKTQEPGGKGVFVVDHDHATSRVRALLCHNCNVMLGGARDDPKVLEAAILYLGTSTVMGTT